MIQSMRKKKPKQKPESVPGEAPDEAAPEKPSYPSRDNYKGTYLPKKLYEELEQIATEDDRSVAYLVRKACEEFVARHKAKPAE